MFEIFLNSEKLSNMKSLGPLVILLLCAILSGHCVTSNTLCAYSKTENVKYKRTDLINEDQNSHHHSIAGHSVDANTTEHCSKESDSCFALWSEDPVNKSIIIITQGCWDSSGNGNCHFSECIANKKPPKALNNTKFCCCSEDMCNINVTDGYVSTPIDPSLRYVDRIAYTHSTVVVIAIAAMTVFLVLALVMYYLFKYYFHPPKQGKESLHLIESAMTPAPMFDFDNLKIQETIGRGRYGTVCRGTLQDHAVAVKIFNFQNKPYFLNEKDIYTLPHMEYPSLLKYIGSEERIGMDGRPEFLMVLSFSAIGCLQDYLRSTTVDWQRLCKMSSSIARGLAHLHTEQGKGEKIKPCIAHRDLTSRNILMKDDGTCMLCDFGFAIRISGPKYFQNGEEQVAETTSLADVGTMRYMAPEILEGAVNLRDCESSLKQIDVYALGLVLWEIATRCTDLFQGVEVPDYKLPFELEIGIHPTMEQMQVLVTRHKARPIFPELWKDSNPAVRTLKETIEECWDQDCEARLTTLCVEERLSELPVLWERYKAGLGVQTCLSTTNVDLVLKEKTMSKIHSSDDINYESVGNGEIHIMRDRALSLSEGTTETLLSPSEPCAKDIVSSDNSKNNFANNVSSSKMSTPLQPHQGHNPCLERNLVNTPDSNFIVKGNTLIESDFNIALDRDFRSYSDGDTTALDSPNMDVSSLVSNDLLSHSTQACSPIPYLLNAVNSVSSPPKQTNVSSNGPSLERSDYPKIKEKCWHPLNAFDRKNKARDGLRAGLKSLLERKSSSVSNKYLSEEQQPLKGYSGNYCSPSSPNLLDNKFGQANNLNYISTPDESKISDLTKNDLLVNTEVRVIKSDTSSTVVRPVNNAQISSKDDEKDRHFIDKAAYDVVTMPLHDFTSTDATFSINKPETEIRTLEKTKRPNSLALQELHNGHYDCMSDIENSDADMPFEESTIKNVQVPMRRKNSNGKRKGVKRVKTPFEIKGRFSLYDDRIMSSRELGSSYSKETKQTTIGEHTKFSNSVPLDMNTLCSSQLANVTQITESGLKNGEVKVKNGFKMPVNLNQVQVINSFCDV